MSTTSKFIATSLFALSIFSISGRAMAQEPCPNGGNVAVVRLSKLKPGGTKEGFDKAVAAHARWYATHGFKEDRLITAPVVAFDRKAKKNILVKDQIMTIHYSAQAVPQEKRDAAWKAYVDLYKANSEIVQETTACLAKSS